jgi:ABC-2 type transport system permease protein
MRNICAIAAREFRGVWYSPIAYIVLTVFLVITIYMFFLGYFLSGNASLNGYFGMLPWAFMFMLPALTMRMWAEELRAGTVELLMTKPVREWEVVLGKYIASVAFLLITLACTLPLAVTVHFTSQNGLDWGVVFTSYLGALLLGMAYLGIGGWMSSYSQNQVVAFILGLAVIFGLVIIGELAAFAPGWMTTILEGLGMNKHFASISRGVIDTRDVLYYASAIFLTLYLTVRSVESRKWS